MGNMIYQDVLDQYKKLTKEFSNVHINYPEVYKTSKSFLLNKNDSINLVNILKSSDILVNIFSTMNIEAAICDIPIINICFEYNKPMYKFNLKNPRFNIYSEIKESHNQRIVDSGGSAITLMKSN